MFIETVRLVQEWANESFFNFYCFFPRVKPLKDLHFTIVKVPNPLMGNGGSKVRSPIIPVDPVVKPRESRESNPVSVELRM